jgi:hypothetical protein
VTGPPPQSHIYNKNAIANLALYNPHSNDTDSDDSNLRRTLEYFQYCNADTIDNFSNLKSTTLQPSSSTPADWSDRDQATAQLMPHSAAADQLASSSVRQAIPSTHESDRLRLEYEQKLRDMEKEMEQKRRDLEMELVQKLSALEVGPQLQPTSASRTTDRLFPQSKNS